MSVGKRAYDILRGHVNREWDRIQGIPDDPAELELQRSLDSPAVVRKDESVRIAPVDSPERARQVLGVPSDADFSAIQAAFERLVQRSNPGNFPEGSREASQAAEIQRRVQQAYALLTEHMDSTEKRFRSLEIE